MPDVDPTAPLTPLDLAACIRTRLAPLDSTLKIYGVLDFAAAKPSLRVPCVGVLPLDDRLIEALSPDPDEAVVQRMRSTVATVVGVAAPNDIGGTKHKAADRLAVYLAVVRASLLGWPPGGPFPTDPPTDPPHSPAQPASTWPLNQGRWEPLAWQRGSARADGRGPCLVAGRMVHAVDRPECAARGRRRPVRGRPRSLLHGRRARGRGTGRAPSPGGPLSESARLVDLRRRLDNLLRAGTVSEVDLLRARVRVHYGAGAPGEDVEAQTEFIPWLTTRAGADRTWWAPTLGEQVLILAPSGDLANAVALPAIYQVAAPPPESADAKHVTAYSDGTTIVYDTEGHCLLVDIPAGGKLLVVGAVQATEDVEDRRSTMQDMRDIFNAHTHPANGSPPSQRM